MNIHEYWAKSDTTNGIITLVMHTKHVVKAAINLMDRLPFSGEEKVFWQEKIIRCAILHDLGKIHKDFQAKLKPDESSEVSIRHEIISLWIIEAFMELDLEEKFAIATHHKGVIDTESNYGRLEHPIIKEDLVIHISKENDLMSQMPLFLKLWEKEFSKYYSNSFSFKSPQSELSKIELSSDIQKLLKKRFQKRLFKNDDQRFQLAKTRGLLIASDHIGSARFEEEIPFYKPIELKDFQPKNEETGDFFDFRNFQEELKGVQKDVILYAPTGSGKTEAALCWIYANQSKNARLFYLLPYTASINAMVIRLQSIFGKDIVTALHSKTLDFFFEQLEEEESNHLKNADLARSMKSLSKELFYPVKVTTPHQVLKNALMGKGWEMSLFDYQNACFIIDEFHAYDALMTGLMLATIRWLKREFNAKIFFMSATIPNFLLEIIVEKIFNGDKTILKQPNPKFESDRKILDKKRHRVFCEKGKKLTSRLDQIIQLLSEGGSVLIIANNVKTSQDLFENIDFDGSKCLLHSGFNKRDRNRIEKSITNKDKSKRPQLLVATQAVEVSLDIDYDFAFIENAPIDALIQRFGRVNRAGKKGIASIYLFEEIIGNTPFYDDEILKETWKEMTKLEGLELSESDLVNACNEVYKNGYSEIQMKDFEKGFNFSTINNFRQELIAGHWRDWIEDAIESNNFKIDVLCHNLLEEFDKFRKEKDFIRANQLLVSVYFYETKPVPHSKSKIKIAYDLDYDEHLGYKKKLETTDNQFL